jgi:transposase
MRIAVMANSDVDRDAPSDLPARGQRVSERSAGCGVDAAGTADPARAPWRTTAQDRHAGGDERHPVSAAHRLSLALLAARQLSATFDGLHIFRKFQREGVWEAIWAELHMALRERMGREASPSAAVLDSQSVKSAEKGAVKTTRWVTTPARR